MQLSCTQNWRNERKHGLKKEKTFDDGDATIERMESASVAVRASPLNVLFSNWSVLFLFNLESLRAIVVTGVFILCVCVWRSDRTVEVCLVGPHKCAVNNSCHQVIFVSVTSRREGSIRRSHSLPRSPLPLSFSRLCRFTASRRWTYITFTIYLRVVQF